MADTRVLLSGLQNYRDALQRHLKNLVEDYQHVERRWQAFDVVYSGDNADSFRARWQITARNFQDYVTHTQRINRMLEERIVFLERLNRMSI